MNQTPAEWVEMAWAAREAAHVPLNQARRARFESLKALLREFPKPNTNLVRIFKR